MSSLIKAELIESDSTEINPVEATINHYEMMVSFVKQAMQKDVDYGIIPGTKKPTLLKPGAEKLCRLFSLRPHFDLMQSVVDFDKPLFHYHYKCTLYNRHGEALGQGEGSCNSRENRYEKQQYKVFDLVNTITKMAMKRSLLAAVLVVCGASEFFSQDMEEEGVSRKTSSPHPSSLTPHYLINESQVKRFRAIATNTGYTTAGAKALLASHGFVSSKDITRAAYDKLCDQAGDSGLAAAFNQQAVAR